METIVYGLTIKDRCNVNKLNLAVKDGITVNDLLYIKSYPEDNVVKFFPIISSDINELDECIGIDNLKKDKFMTTFIINGNLFVVKRGETTDENI